MAPKVMMKLSNQVMWYLSVISVSNVNVKQNECRTRLSYNKQTYDAIK